jgi:hypothetical protein
MGLLFALATLRCVLKHIKEHSNLQLALAALFFFLGLLSKENTITFFAIIPLTLYFFTEAKTKDYIAMAVALALPVIAYLAIRTAYTEAGVTADSPEILNNPFRLHQWQFRVSLCNHHLYFYSLYQVVVVPCELNARLLL